MWDYILGISGVAIGACGQYIIEHFRYRRETEAQRKLDQQRKVLLKDALENPPAGKEWRELTTLSRIIGADFDTTTRLLIELGARGSEGDKEVWALLSKKPLRGTA